MTSNHQPHEPGGDPSGRASGDDPHDLRRFVDAQAPVYSQVVNELRAGRKTSHWMWFVFPQLRGLGHSATAQFFGIASAREALAYLEHPVLGPRLSECTRLVIRAVADGRTVHRIFGNPDDMKLRSCVTLFAAISSDPLFGDALQALFGGSTDALTVDRLAER